MSRLPIRVRLTAAFAIAMMLMITVAAWFVWIRLRDDRNDAVDASLRARSEAALEAFAAGSPIENVALEDPEESFVQVLDDSGHPLNTAGKLREPALTFDEAQAARNEPVTFERRYLGIDGASRVLARAAPESPVAIVAVGQSLNDRNDALTSVVTSFAIGGVIAVALASAIGYALATLAFRPIEAMTQRARHISLTEPEPSMPLSPARDEIRRLGETLNEMLERLQRSFERESRFVADASHELRTPIAVMRTELEGLLLSDKSEPVHDALTSAVRECERLAMLADDLLVLARTTEIGLPVRAEAVDAHDALGAVRERFADQAAEAGRYLALEVEEGLRIWADPERLRQVVTNLIDNALRHGSGDITLSAQTEQGSVRISVRDEGPGFPADLLARAFDPFSRAKNGRTGGSGLGLAIVATIARAHGGSATISTGDSPTVIVWLPQPGTP